MPYPAVQSGGLPQDAGRAGVSHVEMGCIGGG